MVVLDYSIGEWLPERASTLCCEDLMEDRNSWKVECLRKLVDPTTKKINLKSNFILRSLTSLEKTFVAEIFMLCHIQQKQALTETYETQDVLSLQDLSMKTQHRVCLFVSPYVSTLVETKKRFSQFFSAAIRIQELYQKSTLSVERAVDLVLSRESHQSSRCFDIALCTIEKAHTFILALAQKGYLCESVAVLVVDQVELVVEDNEGRGALLNSLLSIAIALSRDKLTPTQIIAMSLTSKNIEDFSHWLNAVVIRTDYNTDGITEFLLTDTKAFRLDHSHHYASCSVSVNLNSGSHCMVQDICKIGFKTGETSFSYASSCCSCCTFQPVNLLPLLPNEQFSLNFESFFSKKEMGFLSLVLKNYMENSNTVIFCPSKRSAEHTAFSLMSLVSMCLTGKADKNREELWLRLHQTHGSYALSPSTGRMEQLVLWGVAYHHSGLSVRERILVEQGFSAGSLSILCATFTVALGVNLHPHSVFIKSPYIGKTFLDYTRYTQMVGRGNGIESGISYLCCNARDVVRCQYVMQGIVSLSYPPLPSSTISGSAPSLRFLLEYIVCVSGHLNARNLSSLNVFGVPHDNVADCWKLFYPCRRSQESYDNVGIHVERGLALLIEMNQVEVMFTTKAHSHLDSTLQGRAIALSGLDPLCGYSVYVEADRLSNPLILDSELHLAYLCCPPYLNLAMNWKVLRRLVEKLEHSDRLSLEYLNIDLSVIQYFSIEGTVQTHSDKSRYGLERYTRLYVALLCVSLIRACPIESIMKTFSVTRGDIESLRDTVLCFAVKVKKLVQTLKWWCIEILLDKFLPFLKLGSSTEYFILMQIPNTTLKLARALYMSGLRTVDEVARASISRIERCYKQQNVLSGHKGNIGLLLATRTSRLANKYLKEHRQNLNCYQQNIHIYERSTSKRLCEPHAISYSSQISSSENQHPNHILLHPISRTNQNLYMDSLSLYSCLPGLFQESFDEDQVCDTQILTPRDNEETNQNLTEFHSLSESDVEDMHGLHIAQDTEVNVLMHCEKNVDNLKFTADLQVTEEKAFNEEYGFKEIVTPSEVLSVDDIIRQSYGAIHYRGTDPGSSASAVKSHESCDEQYQGFSIVLETFIYEIYNLPAFCSSNNLDERECLPNWSRYNECLLRHSVVVFSLSLPSSEDMCSTCDSSQFLTSPLFITFLFPCGQLYKLLVESCEHSSSVLPSSFIHYLQTSSNTVIVPDLSHFFSFLLFRCNSSPPHCFLIDPFSANQLLNPMEVKILESLPFHQKLAHLINLYHIQLFFNHDACSHEHFYSITANSSRNCIPSAQLSVIWSLFCLGGIMICLIKRHTLLSDLWKIECNYLKALASAELIGFPMNNVIFFKNSLLSSSHAIPTLPPFYILALRLLAIQTQLIRFTDCVTQIPPLILSQDPECLIEDLDENLEAHTIVPELLKEYRFLATLYKILEKTNQINGTLTSREDVNFTDFDDLYGLEEEDLRCPTVNSHSKTMPKVSQLYFRFTQITTPFVTRISFELLFLLSLKQKIHFQSPARICIKDLLLQSKQHGRMSSLIDQYLKDIPNDPSTAEMHSGSIYWVLVVLRGVVASEKDLFSLAWGKLQRIRRCSPEVYKVDVVHPITTFDVTLQYVSKSSLDAQKILENGILKSYFADDVFLIETSTLIPIWLSNHLDELPWKSTLISFSVSCLLEAPPNRSYLILRYDDLLLDIFFALVRDDAFQENVSTDSSLCKTLQDYLQTGCYTSNFQKAHQPIQPFHVFLFRFPKVKCFIESCIQEARELRYLVSPLKRTVAFAEEDWNLTHRDNVVPRLCQIIREDIMKLTVSYLEDLLAETRFEQFHFTGLSGAAIFLECETNPPPFLVDCLLDVLRKSSNSLLAACPRLSYITTKYLLGE